MVGQVGTHMLELPALGGSVGGQGAVAPGVGNRLKKPPCLPWPQAPSL